MVQRSVQRSYELKGVQCYAVHRAALVQESITHDAEASVSIIQS